MIISTALLCLAFNIFHEQRSMGYDGMASIAVATMNRAGWDEDKVCDVVFAPKQYSWTNNLLSSRTKAERKQWAQRLMPKQEELSVWEAAKVVAYQALNDMLDSEVVDTIGSADHYYNPKKASPSWASSMTHVVDYKQHRFLDSGGRLSKRQLTISPRFQLASLVN